MPSKKTYERDPAAARMCEEPGKVMEAENGYLCRYHRGAFHKWDRPARHWELAYLVTGPWHDAPDPSKPEPEAVGEVGFEVCVIDESGFYQRTNRPSESFRWNLADTCKGFAGYDWKLPDDRIVEGVDAKVLWWIPASAGWDLFKSSVITIPLTRPWAVRFVEEK